MSTSERPLKLIRDFSMYPNIWSLFEFIISKHGSTVAQVDSESEESITYNDILKKALSCSLRLGEIGVKKGDVVAVMSTNSIDSLWKILGILRIGAICALFSDKLKLGELSHLLELSKPSVVIAPALNKELTESILSLNSSLQLFINKDESCQNSRISPIGQLLIESCSYTPPEACQVQPDDAAFFLSSSGSTGLPKCVIITHKNIINALEYGELFMAGKGPALGLMPFCHAYGLVLMLMALCQKIPLVVMRQFSTEKLLQAVKKHQIAILPIVPSILISLAKLTDSRTQDLKSVRIVMTGASSIPPHCQKIFKEKLDPSVKMIHSYGMTETTFVVIAEEFNENKPSSPGRLLPGISAKVVDENGVQVDPCQQGELVIRCPMVMKGYYKNEKATREAIDREGWLRTGDLVYVDEDGFFFIVDRMKELIKYQGHQISPTEIEMVLSPLKGIKDVVVIGVPHEVYGEVPRAFIVKTPDSDLTEEDVDKTVGRALCSYKQLKGGIVFVDKLPKSPTKKIMRRKLILR